MRTRVCHSLWLLVAGVVLLTGDALAQIDVGLDGKITFDEFWAWWVADDIDKALDRSLNAKKKKKTR